MIWDADTHLPQNGDVRALLTDMDIAGIRGALVSVPLPEQDAQLEPSLAALHTACREYPDRLRGLGYVDPRAPLAENMERIDRCLDAYAFVGIRIDARHGRTPLDDEERMLPLAAYLHARGGLLAVHVGSDTFDWTHPYRLEKLAKRFPDMRILALHMGGIGRPDYCEACFEAAERCENLWLAGGAVYWQRVPQAIRRLGAERVCFGTATPYHGLRPACTAAWAAMLDDMALPEKERSAVWGGNLLRLIAQ